MSETAEISEVVSERQPITSEGDGGSVNVVPKAIERQDSDNQLTMGDRLRVMTSFQHNNIPSKGAKSQLRTLFCREFDKHALNVSRNSTTDEYNTASQIN